MPSPEKETKTIAQNIEEERLQTWRDKRAKVAEASRQERLKIAEADRRTRLEAFEVEKAKRIKEAAESRAQKEAARAADRMNVARSHIAGRTDIAAARERLLSYRQKAAKMLALRLALFVICPTLLLAAYLFGIATPLYSSETKFTLHSPAPESIQVTGTPFASTRISREAHLLREVLVSPSMLETLNKNDGFTEHLSSSEIDPWRRMDGITRFLPGKAGLEQYVDVSVNGQDGIISITALAADPEKAQAFTQTMVSFANAWLGEDQSGGNPMRVVTEPTLATRPIFPQHATTLLLGFLGFLSLYGFVAIFGRTLLRHSEH